MAFVQQNANDHNNTDHVYRTDADKVKVEGFLTVKAIEHADRGSIGPDKPGRNRDVIAGKGRFNELDDLRQITGSDHDSNQ